MLMREIVDFMRDEGWCVDLVRDATFVTSFRAHSRAFNIFGALDNGFLVISILPYVKLPLDDLVAERLVEKLLKYNYSMTLAKFSIDEENDAVLSIDLRYLSLTKAHVQEALDVLVHYAEMVWQEIDHQGLRKR